jgi:uncharacterized membrane protein
VEDAPPAVTLHPPVEPVGLLTLHRDGERDARAALHPILIVFPLGLLATAVIFDVVYLVAENSAMATVAYWMVVAGVIGGLAAGLLGWVDWLAIPPGTRAKRIGLLHGIGNVVVLVLFVGSWWFRRRDAVGAPDTIALVLSFAGAGLALDGLAGRRVGPTSWR